MSSSISEFAREEEEFGTPEERALVVRQIEQWAKNHADPDFPIINLDMLGKLFSPRELAEDIREETALGVVMLDMIISESRFAGVPPIEYVKRLTKIMRGKFPLVPFKDEVN